MKPRRIGSLRAVSICSAFSLFGQAFAKERKPNVVFILADDKCDGPGAMVAEKA